MPVTHKAENAVLPKENYTILHACFCKGCKALTSDVMSNALPSSERCRFVCQVPSELAACSGLAWMSLAGNPACPEAPVRGQIAQMTIEQLALGVPLGEGASGDVFAAKLVSVWPISNEDSVHV